MNNNLHIFYANGFVKLILACYNATNVVNGYFLEDLWEFRYELMKQFITMLKELH